MMKRMSGLPHGGLMMLRLRGVLLREGHHRLMGKTHEAEKQGKYDAKVWAESPERPHVSLCRGGSVAGQLTFGNLRAA